jgi:hypothetical protein
MSLVLLNVMFEFQAEKDAQKKIPPSELFTSQTDKYSKFDDKVCTESWWLKTDR